MRNVVASAFVSLDGIAEQPIDVAADRDGEVDEDASRIIGSHDTVLMG